MCIPTACGDAIISGIEECDDGNVIPGDGCSERCQIERVMVAAAPVCGDGILTVGEQCDDGNSVSGDGCDDFCRRERAAALPEEDVRPIATLATLLPVTQPTRAPVGDTGPAVIAIILGGGTAGFAWMRRKRYFRKW